MTHTSTPTIMSLSPSSSIRAEKHGLGEKSPAETDLERQGSPPSQSSPGDTTTVASENPPHDGDVLLVDWDGPDDKENPKKYVVQSFLISVDFYII